LAIEHNAACFPLGTLFSIAITFLGLNKAHWDFINSFADWIAAFGTVSAVVVSLWLAARPDRLKLNVYAGIQVLIKPGSDHRSRYVVITATHTGRRVVKVSNLGWRYRRGRKLNRHYLVQMTSQGDGLSSPLPVMLEDGQGTMVFADVAMA